MAKRAAKAPQLPAASKENTKSQLEKLDPALAAEIDRQIGSLVPQGQRDQIISRVVSVLYQERFSGPIAHPRHLREYEDIVPGSAERIIRMAEKALDHNAEMSTKIVDAEIEDQRRGMSLGFTALLVILGLAALFGYWNMQIISGLFLGAAVLGSIPVFVMGRNGNKSDSDK